MMHDYDQKFRFEKGLLVVWLSEIKKKIKLNFKTSKHATLDWLDVYFTYGCKFATTNFILMAIFQVSLS